MIEETSFSGFARQPNGEQQRAAVLTSSPSGDNGETKECRGKPQQQPRPRSSGQFLRPCLSPLLFVLLLLLLDQQQQKLAASRAAAAAGGDDGDARWFRHYEEDKCRGEELYDLCGRKRLREYAQQHRSARQASARGGGAGGGGGANAGGGAPPQAKYLTYTCPGHGLQGLKDPRACALRNGFGDQLMGITFAFTLALMLNRTLIIDAPMFAETFDSHLIDWLPGPDVPMNVTGNGTAIILKKKRANAGDVVVVDARGAYGDIRLRGDMLVQLQPLEDADNIVLQASTGMLVHLFSLPHYMGTKQRLLQTGLRLPYALGCIVRFLMHPKKEVRALVHKELQMVTRRGTRSICLHLRTDDFTAWKGDNVSSHATEIADPITSYFLNWTENNMLKCARDIAKFWMPQDESHILWVFSTDYYALKLALKQRYGDKVVTTLFRPLHAFGREHHSEANRQSVAEWHLLTRCDFYVLSQSGFSKTAAGYAMKLLDRSVMFDRFDDGGFLKNGVFNLKRPEPRVHCDLLKTLNIGGAHEWSGW